jgi:hypothetical protein
VNSGLDVLMVTPAMDVLMVTPAMPGTRIVVAWRQDGELRLEELAVQLWLVDAGRDTPMGPGDATADPLVRDGHGLCTPRLMSAEQVGLLMPGDPPMADRLDDWRREAEDYLVMLEHAKHLLMEDGQ